jgi:hypothetical protein
MIDADYRIIEEFDRLVELGSEGVSCRPFAVQVVIYVVAVRCGKDQDGFCAVYEQQVKPPELDILISGLRTLEESELADELQRGYEILQADGFYLHCNWNEVSPEVRAQIKEIGERVGDRLWDLDKKLVALLDST